MKIKFFVIALLISSLFSAELFCAEAERTVITINNAKSTKYEKDKETKNDCIFLSGNVKISVEKGSTKNVISADSIKYDRTNDMLYAEGNVSLDQTTETDGTQTVTASSLMFNTATLEGVFDDGRVVQTQSNAINLPSGSTLIVASDIFGRSESNTIAFKNGVLTFCNDEDPHWKIKASKIWLLPGGEFSFFNALLFVGPVPVMYLPAFYYPKDELIFNPVFGYDIRQGYFVQTTTYIYGRKPLDTSSSTASSADGDGTEKLKALFNFIRPSTLKDQKLEGIVLHNLDTNYKGDTSNYLKVLGDYYANLGWMTGIEGVLKPKKVFSSLEFSARLGFTDTVFKSGSTYSMYSLNTGTKYYDKSNLMGFKLPFRYSASLKMAMSKPFSLNIAMPFYSDPYFNDDFSKRNETMDWISFLTESTNQSDSDKTINEISSFNWTVNGSYTIPLPKVIKPYIDSASISFNSSVAFSTVATQEFFEADDIKEKDLATWKQYTPNRKFYYPSQITPLNVNGSVSGTIFSWPPVNKTEGGKTPAFTVPLAVPEEFKTAKVIEAEKKKLEEEAKKASEEEKKSDENGEEVMESESSDTETEEKIDEIPEEIVLSKDALPNLTSSKSSAVSIPDLTFTSKYSIKPALTTQLAYSNANLKSPDDFKWDKLKSSMYTFKLPVTLDNNLSYGGSFVTLSNNFNFSPVWQGHPYLSKDEVIGYKPSEIDSLKKTDYAAEKRDLTSTNSVSFKPFYYINCIKDTGITYRNTIKMIRTNFIGDSENPEWEYLTTDWSDEDSITTNSLDFTFASNQMDNKFSQSLTLTTTLKPQVENYYGTLKFAFPYVTTQFEAGIKRKSSTDDTWVKQPFKQNFTLSLFGNSLKLSESYNYNLEDNYNDSLKLSLNWKSLQAAYTMSYTTGYDFDESAGWKAKKEKEFLPYSFSLAYAPSSVNLYAWKNRISLNAGLSTSIVADLLRPTNSYFIFSPSLTLKINEFLNLTFSASSRNQVIYRYFSNEIELPGEKNIFVDLWNSFRFDDEDLRKASGFKIKSFKFEITHELHDWDFKTSFKFEPRIQTKDGKQYYDFNPYITISISWRPMSSFKSEIIDDYGEWKLQ